VLAEDAFKRALSRGEHPANSHDVVALQFLAVVMAREKRFGEAGEFAKRAYGIALSVFGENHPQVASALGATAFVEEYAGEFDKAEHDYSESLRIMREHDILDSNAGLEIMTRYAIVLRKLHRRHEAKNVSAELNALRLAAQSAH
jgi:hypothetical protein